MPARQTVDYGNRDWIEITVNPVDEPDNVYFTEDEPKFELVFRDLTDRPIQTEAGAEGGVKWILELGPEGDKQIASGLIELSINPGSIQRITIELGLLGYEANGVLGVTGFSVSSGHGKDDTGPIVIYSDASDRVNQLLYTFTIWDRSHYEAIHEQPKRLQKWVVRLAALTAFFAAATTIFAGVQLYVFLAG